MATQATAQVLVLLFIAGCAVTGSLLLRGFGASLAPFGPPTEPQKVPFLGGSSPAMHAWSRYHLRYYSMTLLFIAFEMEMMFMYPWAVVYAQEGTKALAEMGMFLGILSVGIFYGWREGIFRWQ